MYAWATSLRGINPGLCFTQKAEGGLKSWVSKTFDAQHIQEMTLLPGQCFKLLWRPGIDAREDVVNYLVSDRSAISEAGMEKRSEHSKAADAA